MSSVSQVPGSPKTLNCFKNTLFTPERVAVAAKLNVLAVLSELGAGVWLQAKGVNIIFSNEFRIPVLLKAWITPEKLYGAIFFSPSPSTLVDYEQTFLSRWTLLKHKYLEGLQSKWDFESILFPKFDTFPSITECSHSYMIRGGWWKKRGDYWEESVDIVVCHRITITLPRLHNLSTICIKCIRLPSQICIKNTHSDRILRDVSNVFLIKSICSWAINWTVKKCP